MQRWERSPIRLWNTATGHLIQELDESPYGISFSTDENTLLLASESTSLWDIGTDGLFTQRDTVQFDVRKSEVAKFGPDGKTIATIKYGVDGYSGEGSTIALWDVDPGNRLRAFIGHSGSSSGGTIAVSPSGRRGTYSQAQVGMVLSSCGNLRLLLPDRHNYQRMSTVMVKSISKTSSLSQQHWVKSQRHLLPFVSKGECT